MDGFTIASHIASCAEETIAYNDVPTVLIGPYLPHETLSIKEFISFRLPSLQTHRKNPSSYLSQGVAVQRMPNMEGRWMGPPQRWSKFFAYIVSRQYYNSTRGRY